MQPIIKYSDKEVNINDMKRLNQKVMSVLGTQLTKYITPILLIIGLMSQSNLAHSQNRKCANFKTDFSSAVKAQTVIFEGKTNATNTRRIIYSWNFGDGTKAIVKGQKVTHKYAKSGTYKVCVTAYNPVDSCRTITCKAVKVGTTTNPCNVALDFNVRVSGNTVYYGARSNLNPATYEWIFGDGGPRGNGQSVKHTYAKPGTYKVCVKVTDKTKRCTKLVCKTVVIKPKTKPCTLKGDFRFKVKGNKVYVYGKTNEKASTGFTFGDGGVTRGNRAKHIYKKPGTYTICYIAVSKTNSKCKIRVCKRITIKKPCNIKGDFKSRISGTSAKFWAFSRGGAFYLWSFGDETHARGKDAKHTYKKAGKYKVCLTIYSKDRKCKKVICKVINIRKKPCRLFANYRISQSGNSIKVAGYGNGKHFAWSFGDGDVATGKNAKHTYKKAGKYKVCLIVFGKNKNCKKIICKEVVIKPVQKCIVDFKHATKCLDAKFEAKGSPTAGSTITWTYGDGTSGSGVTSNHTYAKAGTYVVCATLKNVRANCKVQKCYKITVKACPCNITGKIDYKLDCPYIKLSAITNGTIVKWYLNGNLEGTGKYQKWKLKPGKYEICYKAYDSTKRCSVKVCKTIVMPTCTNPCKVTANFSSIRTSKTNYSYKFTNTSTGGVTYKWDFGDNTTSSSKNAIHTYKKAGTYKVCLTIWDQSKKCKQTKCYTLVIRRSSLENSTESNSKIVVYPNPTSTALNFISTTPGDLKVEVLSLSGQIIMNKNVAQSEKLDVSQLAKGIYLIRTININGEASIDKIQKN